MINNIKLMSETSIYQYIDVVKGSKFTDKIKDFISDKETVILSEAMLDDLFYTIRHKSFDYPAKFAVLSLHKKGIIQLAYNDTHKLPTAVPFFRRKLHDGGYGVVVNLSNFCNVSKEGTVTGMDPHILYTLMLTSAFSLVINLNSAVLTNNGVPELYGRLFAATMGKLVNLDTMGKAKMQFYGTKFFYVQLGRAEEKVTERAAIAVTQYMDILLARQVDSLLQPEDYYDLEKLINAIKNNVQGMSKVEYYTFFDRWIRGFGELSAFAIEYIPFFTTVIMALVTSSNSMININAIEKEAAKNDVKELAKFVESMETVIIALDKRS